MYIYENPNWPEFKWENKNVLPLLSAEGYGAGLAETKLTL